jgi:Xaa-Pro dipeptidase
LRDRLGAGSPVSGGEVDDAAREVIRSRGFGDQFIHRTGHSIDPRDLHGSGPHIDNLETRDERLLIPGIGFSIEPGVYLPGDLGVRSEVNAYVGSGALIVTPNEPQQELIIV